MNSPRIIVSALRGGSGKTILSIGVIGAWKQQGNTVIPFKKGPDYIDAGWLTLAAGQPCYNLDSFLLTSHQILDSVVQHSKDSSLMLIEGNRGLYDGIDIEGATSTAELAKLLRAPVILCIDCTKSTRTVAAAVMGCQNFDPDVCIEGVVLNRVAGSRHEKIVRTSIEHHCGVPVLGAMPVLDSQIFPERHMGLVPTAEHAWAMESVEAASKLAMTYVDLDRLRHIAAQTGPFPDFKTDTETLPAMAPSEQFQCKALPRIGVIRDTAFQFYYPENLEALVSEGAELVYLSPLLQTEIPALDALYIGGGFPETHAQALSENISFKTGVKRLADAGLPIYAECGGLMYLGESIVLDGASYPMCGVLPIHFGLQKKPQGHGYTIVTVDQENPFYPLGMEIRGHEFHYSSVISFDASESCNLVFSMKRGAGFMNHRDGVCYKNTLATYTHIHALGTPVWAASMVRKACDFAIRNSIGGGQLLSV